ncbi:potassium channel family protein [Marinobacter adhaerens]|jgi:voltage-gated potassium channel|uniref:Potassium channel family protein n=2 Tax=Marinobacter adhaerens TaxID=1033846 RepID=A0ABX8IM61_9GAMM|nr:MULTISPECIES: potassium channel family protein [Marinobacter]ADP96198.1 potassium channel protein [Marinobacter adhaerens HP15]MBW4980153.1 potassium channel family protein [Marinobacter adhaerens]QWV14203.1 potassium channel family protein [Marinobacter adhaerens]ROQ38889.1 voltage-gated potassium channel [Marinobacter sp. 3-2]
MQRNRRPLNPEHQETHLPMGGMIRRRMKRLFAILGGLLLVQVLIIWAVEDLELFEAAWLTMTTLVTVGYGDYAPQTMIGRFSTIVLMFITSITLLTLIVSDYIEYRFYRRERILSGRWTYKMNDHIIIINTPQHGGDQYFMRFASQIRAIPGYQTIPIMILTRQFPMGLPTELSDIGVVHYHGAGFDPEALKAVHAGSARHIIVLAADEADASSDSLTFDIAHRLTELNLGNHTIVECVNDENRGRFKALGVRTTIRPVRTYPEIMVRSVVAPGSEKVLEDLFNYEHDHPHRYDLTLDDLNWADIVSALVRHGIGTALAYIDNDNEVICHPPTNEEIEGKGLIVLVKSAETPEVSVVEEALERYRVFLKQWRAHAAARETGEAEEPAKNNSTR